MKFAIALSALNLVVSATTLAVVLIGARKAKSEMDSIRTKTNASLGKIKTVLSELEV